jgi:hypothetical protein
MMLCVLFKFYLNSLTILIHISASSRASGCSAVSHEAPRHGRMAGDGHALPKVSLGLAMPYPSAPCEWPPLKGVDAHKAGGQQPSSTPLDTSRRTPLSQEMRLQWFLPLDVDLTSFMLVRLIREALLSGNKYAKYHNVSFGIQTS